MRKTYSIIEWHYYCKKFDGVTLHEYSKYDGYDAHIYKGKSGEIIGVWYMPFIYGTYLGYIPE
jgi:hypothetical protein